MTRFLRNVTFFLIGLCISLLFAAPSFAGGLFKPKGPSMLSKDRISPQYNGSQKPLSTYTVKSEPRIEKTSTGTDITLHRNLDFRHKTSTGEYVGDIIESVKLNRSQLLETLAGCIKGGPLCIVASILTPYLIQLGLDHMNQTGDYQYTPPQDQFSGKWCAQSYQEEGSSNVCGYGVDGIKKVVDFGVCRKNPCKTTQVLSATQRDATRYYVSVISEGYNNNAPYTFTLHRHSTVNVPRPATDSDISLVSDSLINLLNPDQLYGLIKDFDVKADGEPIYKPHEGTTPEVPEKNSITMKPDGTTIDKKKKCWSRVIVDSTGKVKTDRVCMTDTVTTKPDGSQEAESEKETEPDPDSPEQRPGKPVPPPSGSGGGTSGGGDGETPPETESKSDQCEKYPNSLGCMQPGEPDFPDVPGQNISLNFTPVNVGGSAFCPPPEIVNVRGQTLEFSFQPQCDFASDIRPIVVALASVLGLLVMFGAPRHG